ncbi:MAG: hypothetical protein ABJK37_22720 [Paraglaciecola sp.]|uniref:hypothetical protein n=1 Tax=Paraglaciecola sp. TaxID=1920173 RepID=UPI0032973681
MNKNVTTGLLVLWGLALSACGGGGSGSTTANSTTPVTPQPVATLSIEVAELAVSMADTEQKVVPVTVTYTGTKTLTAELSDVNIEGLSKSQSPNEGNFELTFAAGDLLGKIEETAEVTVTVTDGTLTDSATLTISLSNTSLLQLMDKTSAKFDALDTFDVSDELSNITAYVADKAYLYGRLTHDEKGPWLTDMHSLVSTIQSTVASQTKDLLAAVLNQRNELTETDAISLINQANDVLSAAGSEFDQLSEQINALDVPNLTPLETFVISQYNGQFSLFYGNNAYGSETNNQWLFAEKWLLLNTLLPFNTQSCPTNNA